MTTVHFQRLNLRTEQTDPSKQSILQVLRLLLTVQRLTGNSQLSVCVNVSVNVCLSLYLALSESMTIHPDCNDNWDGLQPLCDAKKAMFKNID